MFPKVLFFVFTHDIGMKYENKMEQYPDCCNTGSVYQSNRDYMHHEGGIFHLNVVYAVVGPVLKQTELWYGRKFVSGFPKQVTNIK